MSDTPATSYVRSCSLAIQPYMRDEPSALLLECMAQIRMHFEMVCDTSARMRNTFMFTMTPCLTVRAKGDCRWSKGGALITRML